MRECYTTAMINVVMVWLENDRHELLLARRADHKKQDPGLWGPSVTGKVEPGETFEQALVREANEELMLKPGSYTPRFLLETDFLHPDGETRHFKIYVAQISNDAAHGLRPDPNEVAEIRWLSMTKIQTMLNTKPGEVVVASAFVLWSKIFAMLD